MTSLGMLLFLTSVAEGSEEAGSWYVTPQFGYLFTDSSRNVQDDVQYGVGIGWQTDPRNSIELTYVGGSFDGGTEAVDITVFSIDVLHRLGGSETVAPFLSFGTGYIADDYEDRGKE